MQGLPAASTTAPGETETVMRRSRSGGAPPPPAPGGGGGGGGFTLTPTRILPASRSYATSNPATALPLTESRGKGSKAGTRPPKSTSKSGYGLEVTVYCSGEVMTTWGQSVFIAFLTPQRGFREKG